MHYRQRTILGPLVFINILANCLLHHGSCSAQKPSTDTISTLTANHITSQRHELSRLSRNLRNSFRSFDIHWSVKPEAGATKLPFGLRNNIGPVRATIRGPSLRNTEFRQSKNSPLPFNINTKLVHKDGRATMGAHYGPTSKNFSWRLAPSRHLSLIGHTGHKRTESKENRQNEKEMRSHNTTLSWDPTSTTRFVASWDSADTISGNHRLRHDKSSSFKLIRNNMAGLKVALSRSRHETQRNGGLARTTQTGIGLGTMPGSSVKFSSNLLRQSSAGQPHSITIFNSSFATPLSDTWNVNADLKKRSGFKVSEGTQTYSLNGKLWNHSMASITHKNMHGANGLSLKQRFAIENRSPRKTSRYELIRSRAGHINQMWNRYQLKVLHPLTDNVRVSLTTRTNKHDSGIVDKDQGIILELDEPILPGSVMQLGYWQSKATGQNPSRSPSFQLTMPAWKGTANFSYGLQHDTTAPTHITRKASLKIPIGHKTHFIFLHASNVPAREIREWEQEGHHRGQRVMELFPSTSLETRSLVNSTHFTISFALFNNVKTMLSWQDLGGLSTAFTARDLKLTLAGKLGTYQTWELGLARTRKQSSGPTAHADTVYASYSHRLSARNFLEVGAHFNDEPSIRRRNAPDGRYGITLSLEKSW